ncbi:hypothetical protein [Rhizobium gallicum]|uniref:hypothetical protein n=1 Tax=Rhizobium gallicum TaxID=56730 RepID=UPI0012EB82D1|nr:hypothetical protein [Rhizobium gallicum]
MNEASTFTIFLAVVFAMSIVSAIVLIALSSFSWLAKFAFTLAILSIGMMCYYFAGVSGLSPFSFSTRETLGPSESVVSAVLGMVGAIAGVIGSYFFRTESNSYRVRDLLRPLSFCPITLIPVIKTVEASDDSTFLGLALLFCISYQTGFFWERMLKEN